MNLEVKFTPFNISNMVTLLSTLTSKTLSAVIINYENEPPVCFQLRNYFGICCLFQSIS